MALISMAKSHWLDKKVKQIHLSLLLLLRMRRMFLRKKKANQYLLFNQAFNPKNSVDLNHFAPGFLRQPPISYV
jgi:hypothetical protein